MAISQKIMVTHEELMLLIKILKKIDPALSSLGYDKNHKDIDRLIEYTATHRSTAYHVSELNIHFNDDILEQITIIIDEQDALGDYWGFSKHVWWRLYTGVWNAGRLQRHK